LLLQPSRAHERPADNSTVTVGAMRLHVLDAHVRDTSVLTDGARLRAIMRDAANAGGATVVTEAFHHFPNGGVTGVLVLAQSHLSIHTWPELRLANVDLLTYGSVDADLIMAVMRERLGAVDGEVAVVTRGDG
jgi:S-adenosylmethionine decarboxylase